MSLCCVFTYVVVMCMEAYIAGVLIELDCCIALIQCFSVFLLLILVGYGIGEDVLM